MQKQVEIEYLEKEEYLEEESKVNQEILRLLKSLNRMNLSKEASKVGNILKMSQDVDFQSHLKVTDDDIYRISQDIAYRGKIRESLAKKYKIKPDYMNIIGDKEIMTLKFYVNDQKINPNVKSKYFGKAKELLKFVFDFDKVYDFTQQIFDTSGKQDFGYGSQDMASNRRRSPQKEVPSQNIETRRDLKTQNVKETPASSDVNVEVDLKNFSSSEKRVIVDFLNKNPRAKVSREEKLSTYSYPDSRFAIITEYRQLKFLCVSGKLSGMVIDKESTISARIQEDGGYVSSDIGLYQALSAEMNYMLDSAVNRASSKVIYNDNKELYRDVRLPSRKHITDSAMLLMKIEKSAKRNSQGRGPEETFEISKPMVLFCKSQDRIGRPAPYYCTKWEFVHKGTVTVTAEGKIIGLKLGAINVASNKAYMEGPENIDIGLEALSDLLDSIDVRLFNLESVIEDLQAK